MKLSGPVTQIPSVGPSYQTRLEKLDIYTVEDLLLHPPIRYIDYSNTLSVSQAAVGRVMTIRGVVDFIKNHYSKTGKKMQLAKVSDQTGSIICLWFNQPYLVRVLRPGIQITVSGKVDSFGQKPAFISPDFEPGEVETNIHTGRLVPIYPQTEGVSSKWLRSKVKLAYEAYKTDIREFLPERIIKQYKLATYREAIRMLHFPSGTEEAERGRARLAFNELLMLNLRSVYKKIQWKKRYTKLKLVIDRDKLETFTGSLPFKLTGAQKRSIDEILSDMTKTTPMNRLLEGDVGSGKTVVAATAAFACFLNGYQSVVMAPTQILAQQHYQTLKTLFEKYKLRIFLITSEGIEKDLGTPDIFVGTHALIHNRVDFEKVAFVTIDEQHRFGVEQRAHLTQRVGGKLSAPHVLTMTATPIPRTVALTVYGDLDLSVLEELPKGREPTKTWIVDKNKRESAYEWIKNQIRAKAVQVFVICPLIEESRVETMRQIKSAKTEYTKLKSIFSGLSVGLLHGRQKASEKNDVLLKFKQNKINVLVSTPVVEVGIDIPNASIMVIETAERFGLAQLHQLRGRVGRGGEKSYCLLFTENAGRQAKSRLSALEKTLSGFELAELDLKLRGPGDVFGVKQHGFERLKIASWNDVKLLKISKQAAEEFVSGDNKYKTLLAYLERRRMAAN
jgi:ATP-dependent DNA helicase RecG